MEFWELFYKTFWKGIGVDPRGKKIERNCLREMKKLQKLIPSRFEVAKQLAEMFYPDSGIWVEPKDDLQAKITRILAGINISPAEIMMAKELGAQAVIAHHPFGRGDALIYQVMPMLAEIVAGYGMPPIKANRLLEPLIREEMLGKNSASLYSEIDMAKICGIGLLNGHTPVDNIGLDFLKTIIDELGIKRIGTLGRKLSTIKEFAQASKQGMDIMLTAGKPWNPVEKIAYHELTGGESGPAEYITELAKLGYNTVLTMHHSEAFTEAAEKAGSNLIVLPHMAADSIGMNLWLDQLEKEGIEVIPCGSLIRIKRN